MDSPHLNREPTDAQARAHDAYMRDLRERLNGD